MKHIFPLLLIIMLLTGCAVSENTNDRIIFYYPADSAISSDRQLIAEIPYEGNGNTTEEILTDYFKGAADPIILQLPAGVAISSLKLKEDHATIVLTDQFADLTGVRLTKACICITKTICALTGVSTVTIGCQSELIDGEQSITFSDSTILWTDEGLTPTAGATSPTL